MAKKHIEESISKLIFIFKEESLDEFGRWLGKDVSAITNAARDSKMGIRDLLLLELDLMKPTEAQYRQFLTEFKPTVTDGVSVCFFES